MNRNGGGRFGGGEIRTHERLTPLTEWRRSREIRKDKTLGLENRLSKMGSSQFVVGNTALGGDVPSLRFCSEKKEKA